MTNEEEEGMTYHRVLFADAFKRQEDLARIRTANLEDLGEDERLRCQYCGGYYWRLWVDMGMCTACKSYTMLETQDPTNTNQLEFAFVSENFVDRPNLLLVPWIREQLTGIKGELYVNNRIKDPISQKSEFIVFGRKLRCRFTNNETIIQPAIRQYWILRELDPKTEGRVTTVDEAVDLIRHQKIEKLKT